MSNALLCNEPSTCFNEGPQDGLHNHSTILDDILSRKLLEANFEGKSVRAYTCAVSGKRKHLITLDRFIQFISSTKAVIYNCSCDYSFVI